MTDPADPGYRRWSPAEWALEGIGDHDEICRRPRTAVSDADDPARDAAWIRRLNPAARADEFARWVAASAS